MHLNRSCVLLESGDQPYPRRDRISTPQRMVVCTSNPAAHRIPYISLKITPVFFAYVSPCLQPLNYNTQRNYDTTTCAVHASGDSSTQERSVNTSKPNIDSQVVFAKALKQLMGTYQEGKDCALSKVNTLAHLFRFRPTVLGCAPK